MSQELSLSLNYYILRNFQLHLKKNITTKYLCDFDANLLHNDLNINKDIQIAQKYFVKWFIIPASNFDESERLQEIKYKNEISSILAITSGLHPYLTNTIDITNESILKLNNLINSNLCDAVGECGLDYSNGFPDKSYQIPWFRLQVDLSLRYNKPLYLHIRNSNEDVIQILEDQLTKYIHSQELTNISTSSTTSSTSILTNWNNYSPPCVVHCFTGTLSELELYVSYGWYIGLTGSIMKLNDTELEELLERIPLNRLVIETDAPYMGFNGCRESENEYKSRKYPNVPASLNKIFLRIYSVLKRNNQVETEDELKGILLDNVCRYFRIPLPIE